MIQWFMLQNRAGKTRLSKFYEPHTDEDKRKVEHETFRTLSTRDSKWANFCEFRGYKLVYRRYAHLYFMMCIDVNDNELAALEAIHLFVEILDHYFGQVTELDIVLSFHQVDDWVWVSNTNLSLRHPTMRRNLLPRFQDLMKVVNVIGHAAIRPDLPASLVIRNAISVSLVIPYALRVKTLIVGNVQAYLILDEFILAGEIQETSKAVILNRLAELNMMEI